MPMAATMAATESIVMKPYKRKMNPREVIGRAELEAMEVSTTVPNRSQQKPKLNHLHPHFDGKAPMIQSEDQGYPYPEPGILRAMIQAGVVTEGFAVRTMQGSSGVGQEANKSKVRHYLAAKSGPEHQQRRCAHFYSSN